MRNDFLNTKQARRQAMMDKKWDSVTLADEVQRVRVRFKFAFDNGNIDRLARYGQNFKMPSRKLAVPSKLVWRASFAA